MRATEPSLNSPDSRSPSDRHWRDYLGLARKRIWLVLVVCGAVVLTTALTVLIQRPVYDATVTLLIEPKEQNVISREVEQVYAPSDMNIDYYKTQYELLKSYRVMRETIVRLNLKEHPEYLSLPTGQTEGDAERALVQAFQSHVKVSPVPNSRLVHVTVESIDPRLAADAANTIAAVHIAQAVEMKSGASSAASKSIEEPVEELRRKVEASERRLHEFASQHGLVNVDERKRLVTQKLADLNAQLAQAEMKRVEAEARFKQISENPGTSDSSVEVLSSTLIQTLRSQEIQAAQKVAEMSRSYRSDHPAMAQATSELRELRAEIHSEVQKIEAAVKGEYAMALAREKVLRDALERQKAEVLATGQYEVQYGILTREVESNRQLYDMFLKRMKETRLATDIHASNIFVADPAIASMVPVRPNKLKSILVAAVLALLGSLGLVFFLGHLDTTLKSPPDIAEYLPGVSYLGFLPLFNPSKGTGCKVDLATCEEPRSIFAENVRSIRTNLFLSSSEHSPRAILVTSPKANEGKSTFSVNLAIALAQLECDTVLIDADFRKPRLHKVFNLNGEHGLTHYLRGQAALEEVIRTTAIPNLKVIPCGAIPPNPVELLQSSYMTNLFTVFREKGTYVVLDSSPVMGLSDPLVIGHRVDGVVLVVWASHTDRHEAWMAAKQLVEGKTRLLGTVLQRVHPREMAGYYSYYYPCYNEKGTERATVAPFQAV